MATEAFSFNRLVFYRDEYTFYRSPMSALAIMRATVEGPYSSGRMGIKPDLASDPRDNLLYTAYLDEVHYPGRINIWNVTEHALLDRFSPGPLDMKEAERGFAALRPDGQLNDEDLDGIDRAFATIKTDVELNTTQRITIGSVAIALHEMIQRTI
jgi:hypothetical protein